jgi:agmatinase
VSISVASDLRYVPAAESFLDPVRADREDPSSARAVIVPFGLEASVSYGAGTRHGPQAILRASQQLELFDEELWREPYLDYGVATLREPDLKGSIPAALSKLERLIESVLAAGKFPLVLGGEHSLTAGAIRPFAARYKDLVVLQFDAHADLREEYLGEPFSHAAAMRRVLDHEHLSLVAVGIRAISAGEVEFLERNRHRIQVFWGRDQTRWCLEAIVAPLRGRPVYVSFDVDALDAAVMPATGTPAPGGLQYLHALTILRRAAEVGTIVGADLVELAPASGLHAAEYTAAALGYKILSYALSGTAPRSALRR